MNNKLKVVLVTVSVLLLCTLCFFASMAVSEKDKDTYDEGNSISDTSGADLTSQAQAEASSISDDERKEYTEINVNDFINIFNGTDKKLVLFSRPTCGYCQIAEPILQNLIYTYGVEINNVNTDEMNEEDFNNLSSLDNVFADFGTPLLVVVSNGSIVDSVNGLNNKDGYYEFMKDNGFISE